MNSFTKYVIVLILTLSGLNLFAQNGKIAGKVIDKKTGEDLIGVTVVIEGTAFGAATDYEGNFTINNVKPGKYILVASYVSYNKKVISDVSVNAGEVVKINIAMEESKKDLQEVVINSTLIKETASALLIQQKRSVSISDGVSADMIKKTPDATTSDVMKRVSGTSIQDNKFAVIRGLNDRYNTAYINGAPLPSTESDRKAFSFDIFPSNMLDNMVINKTASPDLPGDFSGGLITINTKDIPENKFISTSFGMSYHSITTGKTGFAYNGGKNDFIGLDDGTRKINSAIPARGSYHTMSTAEKVESSKLFNDNWKTENIAAIPLNYSLQLSGGNSYKVGSKSELGYILSGSYSNSNRKTFVERNRINKPFDVKDNQLLASYDDDITKKEILTGLMANVGYKIDNNNKISFKNALTINSEDLTTKRTGVDLYLDESVPRVDNTYYIYQQNILISNQLIGEHFFTAPKIKAKWILNNNTIKRDIPDFRRFSTRSQKIDPSVSDEYYPYEAQVSNSIDISQTGRFFSTLNEQIQSASLDLQRPLEILTGKKVKTDIKVGGMVQKRIRDFEARAFGYRLTQNAPFTSIYNANKFKKLTLENIFSKELINDSLYIDEDYRAQDVYSASSNLRAGYLMFDQRLFNRFRLAYGVRFESYQQIVNSFERNSSPPKPLAIDTTFNDFLPSLNITYELTEKTNLRLSAFRSVARPEFRELAPFAFYDFNINATVVGNPSLARTLINNYDIRYEIYPGESQLLSVSFFYKDFTNAIESVIERVGSDDQLGYSSNAVATNYGFEIEMRKNFDFVGAKDLTFTCNYAYIQSEVKQDANTQFSALGTRPLQGQSPYILNTSLQYYHAKSRFSAALFVNRIGRRISIVREKNGTVPDLWENPRTVVDLTFSKRVYKGLEVKFGINDILAQDLIFYYDNNKNGKFDNIDKAQIIDPNADPAAKAELDNSVFRYRMGYTISFGISYKFD